MVMVWVIAGILQKQYLVSILYMGQRQEMDNNSVKDFKMYLRFLFYEAHVQYRNTVTGKQEEEWGKHRMC